MPKRRRAQRHPQLGVAFLELVSLCWCQRGTKFENTNVFCGPPAPKRTSHLYGTAAGHSLQLGRQAALCAHCSEALGQLHPTVYADGQNQRAPVGMDQGSLFSPKNISPIKGHSAFMGQKGDVYQTRKSIYI